MMDAIERARAERRLATRLAIALLIVIAALYFLCGLPRGNTPAPSAPAAASESTP